MSRAHLTHCTGRLRPARIAVASAVAVALVGVGAAAGASVPDADGTIRGCVTNRTGLLGGLLGPGQGSLRVIDPATGRCDGSETPIQWNQAGRPGPQGPTGPAGPAGPAGPPGPSGLESLRVAQGRARIPDDATETVHIVSARCQSGETAVSAGFSNQADNAGFSSTVFPVELRRDSDGGGYRLVVTDLFRLVYPNAGPPGATTLRLEVLCAR